MAIRASAFALSILLTSAPALAQMPAGYDDPGPAPENTLPAIVEKLRGELVDPYSIRDFILCDPTSSPAREFRGQWRPARWTVMFALNARNRMGGYTGRKRYRAFYAEGRLDSIVSDDFGGRSGLDAEISRLAERLLDQCTRVPDAEVQRLLAN